MDALLVAIITWLSVNFGLPATETLPTVAFKPPIEIAILHHQAFTTESRNRVIEAYVATPANGGREVVSAYDTRKRTILLPDTWRGDTPAELSVLVHEMVHHLQTVADMRYACPQERETLAYDAQDAWLDMFGTSLEEAFQIDRFTRLAVTTCAM